MSEFLRDGEKCRDSVLLSTVITLPGGRHSLVAALVTALAITGCAPPKPPVILQQTAVAPVGPAYATVVAVREIPATGAPASDPRAAILNAMGLPQAATNGGSSEIVVRKDDGTALSVVQTSSADLASRPRVGERVMVEPSGLPRLVPALPQG